jgi:carbonic anhydrase
MPSPWCNEDWNYASLGTNWECRCHDGENQSPIDLPSIDILEVINLGADINFSKVDTEMVVEKNFVSLYPINKEKSFGTMTSYVGDQYTATQVVFHSPSDHTINGYRYPLEAQVMFKSSDPAMAGKNAIVSVLFSDDVGVKNEALEIFTFDMLNGHGVYKEDAGIDITKLFLGKDYKPDPMQIGKAVKFNYYLYGGSIPFPPCSENTWMIVKTDPVGIAA